MVLNNQISHSNNQTNSNISINNYHLMNHANDPMLMQSEPQSQYQIKLEQQHSEQLANNQLNLMNMPYNSMVNDNQHNFLDNIQTSTVALSNTTVTDANLLQNHHLNDNLVIHQQQTPKIAPRNNEYLQQQQHNNLDIRGIILYNYYKMKYNQISLILFQLHHHHKLVLLQKLQKLYQFIIINNSNHNILLHQQLVCLMNLIQN